MISRLIFGMVCCLVACSYKQSPAASWEIAYQRVEYFFGHIAIKIGTDSCYYLNQGGILKNPPVIQWKSSKKKLNDLYKRVEGFHLQQCSSQKALVTEEPYESIKLVENGQVVFEILKHQQNNRDVSKFDSVLAILRSFVASENNGGKY